MAHLLHIDCSAQVEGSVSRRIAATVRRSWAGEDPAGSVTYRDLGTVPVPYVRAPTITSGYVPPTHRSPEQQSAARIRDELVAELLAADALLVSTPMYNWGIPATLKSWLDQVLVNGVVLPAGSEPGPLDGRPVVVALATGGGYAPGTPRAGWDHVEPYLHTVFRDALRMDLTIISAPLTLAARVPAMAHLADAAEAAREAALAAAEECGRKLAAALNP